jgi:hypothetical protein|tara:strand:+ start:2252 stop:2377 length:126 start_codon:yes stop_codon:yes gene_type:complete
MECVGNKNNRAVIMLKDVNLKGFFKNIIELSLYRVVQNTKI